MLSLTAVLYFPFLKRNFNHAVPKRRDEAYKECGQITIGHLWCINIWIKFPELYLRGFMMGRMPGEGKQYHTAHAFIGVPGMLRAYRFSGISVKSLMFHIIHNFQYEFRNPCLGKKHKNSKPSGSHVKN